MFKLTVVSGPSTGQEYSVKDGENSVGRSDGNDIVLSSSKVSKKHCVLVVSNSSVTVKDTGSSNGTFVNGVLSKNQKIGPGDRVSVGEFVLELSKTTGGRDFSRPKLEIVPNFGHPPVEMPQISGVPVMNGMPAIDPVASAAGPAAPQTLKEKIAHAFETYVLNFLYNLNETQEWKTLLSGLFLLLTVLGSVSATYPVLHRVGEKLEREAKYRALLIARQMVDRNTALIFEKMESKLDITFAEREEGVVSAYLVDMEGRILAPNRKLNQYVTNPEEAAFSALARTEFNSKDKLERIAKSYAGVIAVAEPLRIFNPAVGKNVTVALGLVYFDRTQVVFDQSTEFLTYIQAMILMAISAVVVFFSVYRLTLRPLQQLNTDVDRALKANGSGVSRKYKMEEIDPLIDVVSAALQRAASGSSSSGFGATGAGETAMSEEILSLLRGLGEKLGEKGGVGQIIFSGDRKILFINTAMEEISGIRNEAAIGADITGVARDAAFGTFVEDLFNRSNSADAVGEDFEFSGAAYRVDCMALAAPGQQPRGYILTISKAGA